MVQINERIVMNICWVRLSDGAISPISFYKNNDEEIF